MKGERKNETDTSSARWKISNESKGLLEQEFLRKRFPSPRSKKRLADELNVEPRRIQVWFQNRRQREKVDPDDLLMESDMSQGLERYQGERRGSFSSATSSAFAAAVGGWGIDSPLDNTSPTEEGSLLGASMNNYVDAFDPAMPRPSACGVGGGGSTSGCGRLSGLPGLLSSSDDIVHALMDFDRDGGRPLKRRGGFSLFDSSGSLCELEDRLLAAEQQQGLQGSGMLRGCCSSAALRSDSSLLHQSDAALLAAAMADEDDATAVASRSSADPSPEPAGMSKEPPRLQSLPMPTAPPMPATRTSTGSSVPPGVRARARTT